MRHEQATSTQQHRWSNVPHHFQERKQHQYSTRPTSERCLGQHPHEKQPPPLSRMISSTANPTTSAEDCHLLPWDQPTGGAPTFWQWHEWSSQTNLSSSCLWIQRNQKDFDVAGIGKQSVPPPNLAAHVHQGHHHHPPWWQRNNNNWCDWYEKDDKVMWRKKLWCDRLLHKRWTSSVWKIVRVSEQLPLSLHVRWLVWREMEGKETAKETASGWKKAIGANKWWRFSTLLWFHGSGEKDLGFHYRNYCIVKKLLRVEYWSENSSIVLLVTLGSKD